MHGLPEKPPVPFELKLAVPAGADCEPRSVSVTFTVQVDPWFSATVGGAQPVTLVEVERVVTVNEKLPVLVSCVADP